MLASRLFLHLIAGSMLVHSTASWVQAPGDSEEQILKGQAAYGDWHHDHPGVRRLLTPSDMPEPYATRSASNPPSVIDPPRNAVPRVPPGYAIQRFASGLQNPRLVRVAPDGNIFVAETAAGQIRVLHAADGASRPDRTEIFANDLDGPFGIAFYPPGPDPQWVYVATVNAVVRFPYRAGDLTARGRQEVIVAELAGTTGYHTTRDIQFSLDGRRMFVSVGSGSNVAEEVWRRDPEQIRRWEAQHGVGAALGDEADRADVLAFDPDGRNRRVFATGLRNCVGLAVHPRTGDLWCSTNERDGLGDNLVPDYLTRVREGAFYGWPWYYIGANEDPRHKNERADLAGHVTVPDVLVQPHSASMEMTFYEAPAGAAAAFPADVDGDAFAAFHGSWNRAKRTGYKLVRLRLHHGVPTGVYEDFMTGFVIDNDTVWGRPVGVAVAHDGALLVTEDGNGTIWRIAYMGQKPAMK
jgi:glucose/arabinose dehydrogenase